MPVDTAIFADGRGPTGLERQLVVGPTPEPQTGDIRSTATNPVQFGVHPLAVDTCDGTVRHGAPAVTRDHHQPLGLGGKTLRPPQIQRFSGVFPIYEQVMMRMGGQPDQVRDGCCGCRGRLRRARRRGRYRTRNVARPADRPTSHRHLSRRSARSDVRQRARAGSRSTRRARWRRRAVSLPRRAPQPARIVRVRPEWTHPRAQARYPAATRRHPSGDSVPGCSPARRRRGC